MFGWINDCTENLIVSKFGVEKWHEIKEQAECTVEDKGFIRHQYYSDDSTVALVVAASKVLDLTVDEVLEAFGQFFMEFVRQEGYSNMLCSLGSNMRLWLSNLNALHDHLASALPPGFIAPVFWCEDDDKIPGSILVHYYSKRGSLLVPLVVGLIKEVARFHFNLDIVMDMLNKQDEDEAKWTTWRISTVDPNQSYKLTTQEGGELLTSVHSSRRSSQSSCIDDPANSPNEKEDLLTLYDELNNLAAERNYPRRNSFGSNPQAHELLVSTDQRRHLEAGSNTPELIERLPEEIQTVEISQTSHSYSDNTVDNDNNKLDESHKKMAKSLYRNTQLFSVKKPAGGGEGCPFSSLMSYVRHISCLESLIEKKVKNKKKHNKVKEMQINKKLVEEKISKNECPKRFHTPSRSKAVNNSNNISLSSDQMKTVFPHHVVVDHDFNILQVGKDFEEFIQDSSNSSVNKYLPDVLTIVRPVFGQWEWDSLHKLQDQTFFMKPTQQTFENQHVKLKGNLINLCNDPVQVLFILSPDCKNINEMRQMNLTMSDLPLHSFQRDAVFLGEHISSEVRSAYKLEKLSKRLQKEKSLSNALLHQMLPENVARDLRHGLTVDPEYHEHVTLFFSDVVGFTTICSGLEAWNVIAMLNKLYKVMDSVATQFGLYKVETIGDAYVACSGLPNAEENHAFNVANFALVVRECVKEVKNPLDGKSLELRIGIHSGSCMAGVVGNMMPRYCLFGDFVNTTSRHESTGLPNKIQCSQACYEQITSKELHPKLQYNIVPRGLVDMKGKGMLQTYWLEEGTNDNIFANYNEVQKAVDNSRDILANEASFSKRKYFSSFRYSMTGSMSSL